jgi:hypothetical protein
MMRGNFPEHSIPPALQRSFFQRTRAAGNGVMTSAIAIFGLGHDWIQRPDPGHTGRERIFWSQRAPQKPR